MSWSHRSFEGLASMIGARTGLVFVPDRRAGAEQGVRRAMARAGFDDPERYRVSVTWSDALLDDLLAELTVGETYFYREPAQFEFLRREVLPAFRDSAGPVRAWSAGCASGEEAYSLAMLFQDEGLAPRARVLATDISRAVLSRACAAEYGAWSLRGDGAAFALPHLRREGERYAVDPSVRRLVTFEHLNLAVDVYPSFATGTMGVDLIFCRNVLIYFDPETVRAVTCRLAASLSPGGWLVTASSDPPLGPETGLETVVTDQGVFYRRPRPEPYPVCDAAPASRPEPGPDGDEDAATGPRPSVEPAVEETGALSLASARADLACGRYEQAAEKVRTREDDPVACALYVRALANLDPGSASRACAAAVERHPFSAELHYLHAVLLIGLSRDGEAAGEARRVIYLDRTLAVAHFLLGSVSLNRGDRAGARRSFRNARDLCASRPPGEVLPLSDGEPAGRLGELARLQLERIGADEAGVVP